MPPLFRELMTMVNRMPASDQWRRLRIAVTAEELNEWREFIRESEDTFYHAVRGVPLVIEPYPNLPAYTVEPLNAPPSQ